VAEGRISRYMERHSVRDAADILGITTGAVRSRLSRGTLQSVKEGGMVYVLLPPDAQRHAARLEAEREANREKSPPDAQRHAARDATDMPGESSVRISELRSELREHNASLREQLEAEREANRENRRIIAGLIQRVPELPPASSEGPTESSEGPTESPETATDEPGIRVTFRPSRRRADSGQSMEYRISGEPEYILGRVRSYFESDAWPYRPKEGWADQNSSNGLVKRDWSDERSQVTYRVDPGPSARGFLVWLIGFGLPFGVVTYVLGFSWVIVFLFGVAIAMTWLFWVLFERESSLIIINVSAIPTSEPDTSKVVLAVGRDTGQPPTRSAPKDAKYWRPVAKFIEHELGGVRESRA
jgi:hypothetical protein